VEKTSAVTDPLLTARQRNFSHSATIQVTLFKEKKMKWMRMAAVVFSLIMIAIVVCADAYPGLFKFVYAIPGRDKVGHLLLLAMLSFLINGAIPSQQYGWRSVSIFKGSIVIFIIMVLEETSQLFFPGRTFSWKDMLANTCGIAIGDRLAYLFQRYRIQKTAA
jgi:polysaccharide biosynthesis protein VpsQ